MKFNFISKFSAQIFDLYHVTELLYG